MKKYKTIEEFLEDLDLDKRSQVEMLRDCIMKSEKSLTENIKWNAPNYVYNGNDRITFNLLNKEGIVKIILHKGASEKEDKKAPPILKEDDGLIQWNSNIRGTLSFDDLEDIERKLSTLHSLFKKWLSI